MREGKRADALIVLVALCVSLCLFLSLYGKSGAKTAKVYQDGELICTVKLDEVKGKTQIEIKGSVLVVENGEIYYTNSDCPDKLCESFGHLKENGDTASCVPNKTVVTVEESEKENDADIITY